jgi:hypothetical protein
MLRTEIIRVNEAWVGLPDATVTNSFQGGYSPRRIFGPARLLRLLYGGGLGAEGFAKHPSNVPGQYWFAEADVLRIKNRLELDARKGAPDRATYLNRMAFALRNEFRQLLAVCRDWTPRFDTLARLTVPPGKSVVGLVGPARGQNVYSSSFPGHEQAVAPDTHLAGGLTQYVLRFDVPANGGAPDWIRDGLSFDSLYR